MSFVDRSNVNAPDNYSLAHSKGLRHAYFKVTEGTDFVDSTFRARAAAARHAGVVVGGYHFGGHNSPAAEADFFLAHLGTPRPGDLKPVLDLESGQSVAWAEQFVSHMKAKLGYFPVLYGNTSTIGPMRQASAILRACPLWRAEYNVNDGRAHALASGRQGAVLHQFTSVGRLVGITGNTDLNRFVANPVPLIVPHPKVVKRLPKMAWIWAQWKLRIGRYRPQKGRTNAFRRPPVPKRIPLSWWRAVAWYKKHLRSR